MIPVRTRASNFVYRGPQPGIEDAWVERRPERQAVYLTWQLSDEERAALAAGGMVRLGIYGMEPIPPVSLEVTTDVPLSPAGALLRNRARHAMENAGVTNPWAIPPGWWSISADVWAALQAEGALDPSDGVPSLMGRPLMVIEGDADAMEYVKREGKL